MTRLLALVLAVLLLAGCDITGTTKKTRPPKPLSQAQFVHAANRACVRYGRRLKGFKPGRDLDTILAQERKIFVPAYERLLFDLHRLTPPRVETAAFHRVLASLNEEDIVLHNLLDAAAAHQRGQVKRLVRRADVLGKRLNSRTARVGLRHCGETKRHR